MLSYLVNFTKIGENQKVCRDIFRAIDRNRNGELGRFELIDGFSIYFEGDQEKAEQFSEDMISKLDLAGKGLLDYSEFLIGFLEPESILEEQRISELFQFFDFNNSGAIKASHLIKILSKGYTVENDPNEANEWENIIDEVDMSGEGEISIDDFRRMMHNLFSSPRIAYSAAAKTGNQFSNFKHISGNSLANFVFKTG